MKNKVLLMYLLGINLVLEGSPLPQLPRIIIQRLQLQDKSDISLSYLKLQVRFEKDGFRLV